MQKSQLPLAAFAAGSLGLLTMAPAYADSAASTRNIIAGVAAIAGIAIESNVAHRNAQARTLSGYLPDGSAVYGDGHVVTVNGYSYYPGNSGQNIACADGRCTIASAHQDRNGYAGNQNNGYGQHGYDGDRDNGNWVNGDSFDSSRRRAPDHNRDDHNRDDR